MLGECIEATPLTELACAHTMLLRSSWIIQTTPYTAQSLLTAPWSAAAVQPLWHAGTLLVAGASTMRGGI
jgi:hypothetical protein